MRAIVFIFITLISPYFLMSQELLPVELDTTNQSAHFSIQGNAFYLSSGIQNDISRKLLFGGAIDKESKMASLNEHDGINRLGGDIRLKAQYFSDNMILKKYKNLSWMIDAGYETHFSAQYAKSLFGLAFFGNDNYRGESANFSNSFGRIQSFYTLGFGLHDKKTKSFLSLNAVLPTADINTSVDKGNLYTSNDSDTLMLTLKGDTKQSVSPALFQGIGAAINFDFRIPISTKSNNMSGFMSITGRNLGAYYLNSVSTISADASVQFEGYSVADLISLQEESGNILNDSLNVSRDTTSGWRMTPGFIQVGKIVERYTDKQVQAFFGVRMYTNRVYKPLGYAGVHWNPLLNWSLGAQVSFGGYGDFRGGLYAGYSSERFILSLGTEDVLGLISGRQFGQSALIRLTWRI